MVQIPDEVFTTFNSFVDDFINSNFGVNCQIFFSPIKQACDCTRQVGSNHAKHGGPSPFFSNNNCVLCGGSGYKDVEVDPATIKMQLIHSPKQWVKLSIPIEVPDGSIQAIGFLSDVPAIQQASYILMNSDMQAYTSWRYKLWGEIFPYGFKQNRYFVAFFERV